MVGESNPKKADRPSSENVAIPAEREKFNALVLGNPNYFGTFPKFGGKVVKQLSSDTTYEELTCLGLNPFGALGSGLLEAVVNIKQHFGYGTHAWGAGTTGYGWTSARRASSARRTTSSRFARFFRGNGRALRTIPNSIPVRRCEILMGGNRYVYRNAD